MVGVAGGRVFEEVLENTNMNVSRSDRYSSSHGAPAAVVVKGHMYIQQTVDGVVTRFMREDPRQKPSLEPTPEGETCLMACRVTQIAET